MTKFNAGQKVEVDQVRWHRGTATRYWRQAKIIGAAFANHAIAPMEDCGWVVEFSDGTRGLFKADHMTVRCPACGQHDPAHASSEC